MKEIIKQVIEEHMALCFESTKMALELICETLFYTHHIDAKYMGRSIYVGDTRVASIVVSVEGPKCIAIWKYWVF